MAQSELWFSGGFWRPPYRSWPYEPTRLEVLATRMGIGDEELLQLLRDEVQRRLRERGEAWDALELSLEKRERRNGKKPHRRVAQGGDSPEAPPVHHQHGI